MAGWSKTMGKFSAGYVSLSRKMNKETMTDVFV